MSDPRCIYCGSSACCYGRCQMWHIPGMAFYDPEAVCGSCFRPFALGEQYHSRLEAMIGNNFISLTVCGKCALGPETSSGHRRDVLSGARGDVVLEPLDGPVGRVFTRETGGRSHDLPGGRDQFPAKLPWGSGPCADSEMPRRFGIRHLLVLLGVIGRRVVPTLLRRFVIAHIADCPASAIGSQRD